MVYSDVEHRSLYEVDVATNLQYPVILIHGGWAGGWQWGPVAARLRAHGIHTVTPTLPGLGSRKDEASPDMDLSSYISDIEQVAKTERSLSGAEDSGVNLVGFSYSGMVIAGVADRIPSLIKKLIFVDAFIPRNGQSLADIFGPRIAESMHTFTELYGDGWRVPSFLDKDPRLTPQPIRTTTEPVRLNSPEADLVPRVYIRCSKKSQEWIFTPILDRCADYARRQGWEYHELASNHFPMDTDPEALTKLLLAVLK